MGTTWLHWIAKQQSRAITTVEFLSEARRIGILLQVSFDALLSMSWNDQVYLIHKQDKNKRGSVFCSLPISLVSGLSVEAVDALVEEFSVKEISEGNGIVERLSGEYLEGNTWRVEASLQEICGLLKKLKRETPIGSLTVGCMADEFSTLSPPWARLVKREYSPGFSPFNETQFLEDVIGYKNTDVFQATFEVHLESDYLAGYPAEKQIADVNGGNVQWVNAYTVLDGGLRGEQLDLFA